MLHLTKFFTAVLLAVVYASSVTAGPAPAPVFSSPTHTTHRRRELRSGLTLETYHPASTYETFGEGIDHPLRKRAETSLLESAAAFLQDKLRLKAENAVFHAGFSGAHARHAYAKQSHEGIFFANAVANVAFNEADKVVAFGSSFVSPTSIASSTPSISFDDARATAEEHLGGSHDGLPAAELKYFAKADGSAALVHAFQVRDEAAGTWYEALVDAHDGKLLSVVDYVSKASYRVIPIQKQSVPDGFETLRDPSDRAAVNPPRADGTPPPSATPQPHRMHGNNVVSYKGGPKLGVARQSAPGQVFAYTQDASKKPTVPANVAAAIVNNFYIVNTVHDIAYRYGFTEDAFNFQNDNLGHGGKGGDRITASIQDASEINNADITVLPDGQPGHMRMFLFNYTKPQRDSAFANDIVVHEVMHGITNRMTGGGTAACLQSLEANGMGEGWSDALAEWTEQKSAKIVDFTVGTYLRNDPVNFPAGFRIFPYSTSKKVNPWTYASVAKFDEVHIIGEVWANMLHNVYAALVKAYGWSPRAFTHPEDRQGNVVFLHLVIDALPLQPCEPTFLTARDAIIQADRNRYGGANKCLLWKAFASRGLGVKAKNHKDDASVPAHC
ncbi:Fungalysin metallopeptidase-domain-containing protein [Mycena rebaudengoi]|nr:Fungalysin metallopeptidase-domain-containing protein [Mycena rebaudengoi]